MRADDTPQYGNPTHRLELVPGRPPRPDVTTIPEDAPAWLRSWLTSVDARLEHLEGLVLEQLVREKRRGRYTAIGAAVGLGIGEAIVRVIGALG